jgi:hypothetical protein
VDTTADASKTTLSSKQLVFHEHSTRSQQSVTIGKPAPRYIRSNSNRNAGWKNSKSAVDITQPDDHYIPSSASSLFRPHRSPAQAKERWGFFVFPISAGYNFSV